MTFAEIARELGFGEDFEGFRTWADMHNVSATDEVPGETVQMLREAKIESDKHNMTD